MRDIALRLNFLHRVLDKWFERVVKPRLRGSSRIVRYADEFVILSEYENDAQRVLEVLGKRLGKYGLTLHATKTRFIDFHPPQGNGKNRDAGSDFLGFTHVWESLVKVIRFCVRLPPSRTLPVR